MEKETDWIVIELSSGNENLIHELVSSLYAEPVFHKKIDELKIDFSIIGIGISLTSRRTEISSDEVALKKILEIAASLQKKILVVIDEISNTKSLRTFCSAFNVCKGNGDPIYLVMDGLYRNTHALENVSNLTFLKRVPKLRVGKLDIGSVVESYRNHLNLDAPDKEIFAKKLARLSKCYPYAYQLIGYYSWLALMEDSSSIYDFQTFREKILREVRTDLNSYVYETIWGEMSDTERDIVSIISVYGLSKVADIRRKFEELYPERAAMTPGNFSRYRDRLINTDVLENEGHGMLSLALPEFAGFVSLRASDRFWDD